MSATHDTARAPYAGQTAHSVDELRAWVGKEIGLSDWLEISQERVDQFAALTGDRQFIHIDPERARETFFGGTVAHGFLTLSLTALLGWEHGGDRLEVELGEAFSVNYGLNRVRFPAPVPVGSRIRMRTTLIAVEQLDGGAVQAIYGLSVEVEGSAKPACVADLLVRFYGT